jgi:peptidylprolyl isomerase
VNHETAKQGDTVGVHYRGRLQDGSVFDETFDRQPLRFTIGEGQLISGFEEAVVGMKPGERVPIPQPDGSAIDVMVTEVTESKVTVDFNHPFAGQDLTIDIKLLDIV